MFNSDQWFDVTLRGGGGGQLTVNHFYYGVIPLTTPYAGLINQVALDFQTIVLPKIVQVCNPNQVFTSIDVEEHVTGSGVISLPLTSGNVGLSIGDQAPPFVAWAFKSIRVSADVRSAHKRFGLVSETAMTNGVAVPAALTDLNLLAAALGMDFDTTNGGFTNLTPLAVSWYDDTTTPSTLRTNPQFEPARTWQYQKVTSQVSRRA